MRYVTFDFVIWVVSFGFIYMLGTISPIARAVFPVTPSTHDLEVVVAKGNLCYNLQIFQVN